MKIFLKYSLTIFLFVISCSQGIGPSEQEPLRMRYVVQGTWIHPALLDVESTGTVVLRLYDPCCPDSADSVVSALTETEMNRLTQRMAGFDRFSPHYHPTRYVIDGTYQMIIRFYKQSSDTVTVYQRADCVLPDDLEALLDLLENLRIKLTALL